MGTLEQDVSEPIQVQRIRWQTGTALCCAVLVVGGELVVTGDTQLGEETDECLHRQLVGCVLKQSVRGHT